MPPRLLPESYHIVDTLRTVGGLWSFDSGPMNAVSNQYAAMPSLHFAWSLWCALALGPAAKNRSLKVLVWVYPALTLLCIVVTGNHYLLDALGGAVTLALGYGLARLVTTVVARRRPRTAATGPTGESPAEGTAAAPPPAPPPSTPPTRRPLPHPAVGPPPRLEQSGLVVAWANLANRRHLAQLAAGARLAALARLARLARLAPRRLGRCLTLWPTMTVTSGTIAPAFMAEIAARTAARMSELLEADQQRWSAVDADLTAPLKSLQRLLLAGGKRLRPIFCHWAFVGLGGDPTDQRLIDAGAALELLHTFALIHDDVMDDSARRHGNETIHTEFARMHEQAGWRGEHRRFGEGVAILVGDLAFVYSDMLLRNATPEAWDVFHQLRIEVNVGQYLDLMGTARAEASPELARRICQYKSAKYTVERPLHLGVALGAPERLHQLAPAFSAYGLPLGEAFQLRDDILDTFGDPDVTGKAVGDDLREAKPTLLYALARQRATGSDAAFIAQRFGAPDLLDEEIAALQAIFEATGARREVEVAIEQLVDESLRAAQSPALPITDEARSALVELARFVAGRNY